MRIALFSDHFFPELGGIQDSMALLARELGARGNNVDIFVPRYAARDYQAVDAPPVEIDLGPRVRVHRRMATHFPSSTNQSRFAVPSIVAALIATIRKRPDIVHLHSCYGMGIEGLAVGRMLGVPVAATNHTAIQAFAAYLPIPVAWATAYYRWFHNRCDVVSAPSQSVFEGLGATRLRKPLHIISNPIDMRVFAPVDAMERQRIRATFGLKGDVIAFAGRLGPEKNLRPLVEATARLARTRPDVTLAIAGHGSHQVALAEQARQTGAPVRFLGTLPPAQLARFLAAADVFAMPSTSETQSMVMLQAMACGLPVVAANALALPEFMADGRGTLVDPDDADGFARALGQALDKTSRQTDNCATPRQFVAQYDIATVVSQWESVYRSTIERHQHHGRRHKSQLRRSGV